VAVKHYPFAMSLEDLTLWTRYALGRLTVKDGSLCKFSRRFFDIHDVEPRKGGDGIDLPGKIHHCPYCGKSFV